MLQYSGLARQVSCWRKRSRHNGLYRDSIVGLAGKEIISQYKILYCDMGAKGKWAGMYCNTATAPATQPGIVPATRHRRWVWAGRASVLGHAGREGAAGARGARQELQVRGLQARGARAAE